MYSHVAIFPDLSNHVTMYIDTESSIVFWLPYFNLIQSHPAYREQERTLFGSLLISNFMSTLAIVRCLWNQTIRTIVFFFHSTWFANLFSLWDWSHASISSVSYSATDAFAVHKRRVGFFVLALMHHAARWRHAPKRSWQLYNFIDKTCYVV